MIYSTLTFLFTLAFSGAIADEEMFLFLIQDEYFPKICYDRTSPRLTHIVQFAPEDWFKSIERIWKAPPKSSDLQASFQNHFKASLTSCYNALQPLPPAWDFQVCHLPVIDSIYLLISDSPAYITRSFIRESGWCGKVMINILPFLYHIITTHQETQPLFSDFKTAMLIQTLNALTETTPLCETEDIAVIDFHLSEIHRQFQGRHFDNKDARRKSDEFMLRIIDKHIKDNPSSQEHLDKMYTQYVNEEFSDY